jgi:hypothetical protein
MGSLLGCEPTPEFLPRDLAGSWAGTNGTVDVQLRVTYSVTTKTDYLTNASYPAGLATYSGFLRDSRVSAENHAIVGRSVESWARREQPVEVVSIPLARLEDDTYVYGYSFIGRPASKTAIPGHIYRTSRQRDEPAEATRLDSIGFTLRRQ